MYGSFPCPKSFSSPPHPVVISLRRGDIWPNFWPRQLVSLASVKRPRSGGAGSCTARGGWRHRRGEPAGKALPRCRQELRDARLTQGGDACVASNVNLHGISKSLALGSSIARCSPTLCLLFDTFVDCRSCKSLTTLALHIYNPTTRSHASFSMRLPFLCQKHGFLLHFWPGLGVGLLAKCCAHPPKRQHFYLSQWLFCLKKDGKVQGLLLLSLTEKSKLMELYQ